MLLPPHILLTGYAKMTPDSTAYQKVSRKGLLLRKIYTSMVHLDGKNCFMFFRQNIKQNQQWHKRFFYSRLLTSLECEELDRISVSNTTIS